MVVEPAEEVIILTKCQASTPRSRPWSRAAAAYGDNTLKATWKERIAPRSDGVGAGKSVRSWLPAGGSRIRTFGPAEDPRVLAGILRADYFSLSLAARVPAWWATAP